MYWVEVVAENPERKPSHMAITSGKFTLHLHTCRHTKWKILCSREIRKNPTCTSHKVTQSCTIKISVIFNFIVVSLSFFIRLVHQIIILILKLSKGDDCLL